MLLLAMNKSSKMPQSGQEAPVKLNASVCLKRKSNHSSPVHFHWYEVIKGFFFCSQIGTLTFGFAVFPFPQENTLVVLGVTENQESLYVAVSTLS